MCVCMVSVLIYHRSAPSQPLVCFCAGETHPMIHCCVPKLTNRGASAEQREVQAHLLMTVLEVLPQCPTSILLLLTFSPYMYVELLLEYISTFKNMSNLNRIYTFKNFSIPVLKKKIMFLFSKDAIN